MTKPNFDAIFNALYGLRPTRRVVFRKATAYDPATSTITFAPGREIAAKIWDKPRTFDFQRGAIVTDDRTSIVIWFRDWFNRPDDSCTPAELAQMIADAKGQIREGDAERYSIWEVDGIKMKVQSHSLIQRPDGRVYSIRLWLTAAQ